MKSCMKKTNAIIFLFLYFSTSVKAQLIHDVKVPIITVAQTKTIDSSLDQLIPQVLSGQKEEIRTAIHELATVLPDIGRIFQETSSRLTGIGETFFYSAESDYKELKKNISSSIWKPFPFNKRLKKIERLIELSKKVRAIERKFYLSLIFFSYAGFDSPVGKNKYLSALYQFQLFYDFLFQLYKKSNPALNTSIKNNLKTERTMKNFQSLHDHLMTVYWKAVRPSFQNLSWLQKDSIPLQILPKYNQVSNKHHQIELLYYTDNKKINTENRQQTQADNSNKTETIPEKPAENKKINTENRQQAQADNGTFIPEKLTENEKINTDGMKGFKATKTNGDEPFNLQNSTTHEKENRQQAQADNGNKIETFIPEKPTENEKINTDGMKGFKATKTSGDEPFNLQNLTTHEKENIQQAQADNDNKIETFIPEKPTENEKINTDGMKGFKATKTSGDDPFNLQNSTTHEKENRQQAQADNGNKIETFIPEKPTENEKINTDGMKGFKATKTSGDDPFNLQNSTTHEKENRQQAQADNGNKIETFIPEKPTENEKINTDGIKGFKATKTSGDDPFNLQNSTTHEKENIQQAQADNGNEIETFIPEKPTENEKINTDGMKGFKATKTSGDDPFNLQNSTTHEKENRQQAQADNGNKIETFIPEKPTENEKINTDGMKGFKATKTSGDDPFNLQNSTTHEKENRQQAQADNGNKIETFIPEKPTENEKINTDGIKGFKATKTSGDDPFNLQNSTTHEKENIQQAQADNDNENNSLISKDINSLAMSNATYETEKPPGLKNRRKIILQIPFLNKKACKESFSK